MTTRVYIVAGYGSNEDSVVQRFLQGLVDSRRFSTGVPEVPGGAEGSYRENRTRSERAAKTEGDPVGPPVSILGYASALRGVNAISFPCHAEDGRAGGCRLPPELEPPGEATEFPSSVRTEPPENAEPTQPRLWPSFGHSAREIVARKCPGAIPEARRPATVVVPNCRREPAATRLGSRERHEGEPGSKSSHSSGRRGPADFREGIVVTSFAACRPGMRPRREGRPAENALRSQDTERHVSYEGGPRGPRGPRRLRCLRRRSEMRQPPEPQQLRRPQQPRKPRQLSKPRQPAGWTSGTSEWLASQLDYGTGRSIIGFRGLIPHRHSAGRPRPGSWKWVRVEGRE